MELTAAVMAGNYITEIVLRHNSRMGLTIFLQAKQEKTDTPRRVQSEDSGADKIRRFDVTVGGAARTAIVYG